MEAEYPNGHYKLIEELKIRNIIKSKEVARVMKAVDRADFTDLLPYTDCPSPIGYSTSIAAPHMHAMILVLLLIPFTNFPGITQESLNRQNKSLRHRVRKRLFLNTHGKPHGYWLCLWSK